MSNQIPVLTSNTMDFLRTSINQLATRLNTITDTSFVVNGNVIITLSDPVQVALNVSNGTIRGNGSQLFSINAQSLSGTANNSYLQNTTFTITAANGLASNVSTVSLGGAISIQANVIDSITSNITDLPASANSVRWAMLAANAVTSNASVVSYVVEQDRGGTGKTTHEFGKLLIGNTLSQKLETGTIVPGHGIIVTSANGSMTVSANLVAGQGIQLQSTGNSGITITSNAYSEGNTTVVGVVRLFDGNNSTSTTLAATANAVNALMVRLSTVPTKNTFGRLLSRNVYTTSNFAGISGQTSGTQYTWTKPENTKYVNIMVMSGGAAGGSSLNVWNDSETRWFPRVINVNNHTERLTTAAFFGGPGAAGSTAYWSGPAETFGDTVTLFVGGGGTTRGGGIGNGGDSWIANTSFLRVPGAPSTNNILTAFRTGSDRASASGNNARLSSPYSDMAGGSDPLSTLSRTLNTAKPEDQWQGYIKGSNNAINDTGTYTENPNFWDVFRGLSQGVAADLPALGLPWQGIISNDAPGRVTYHAPGSIWPIYGGKGGSTPFGRGGYGGVITTDRTPSISNIKGTGNTPGTGAVYTGNVISNFVNDLWYSFGAPSGIYTANGGSESSASTSTTPVAYGAAPHVLSVTKGIATNFVNQFPGNQGYFDIPVPSDCEVGDRLTMVFATNIFSSFGVAVEGNSGPNVAVVLLTQTNPQPGSSHVSAVHLAQISSQVTQSSVVRVNVGYINSFIPPTKLLYFMIRTAKNTGIPIADWITSGTSSAGGGRANAFIPPREINITAQGALSGRTTNNVLYITFTGSYHTANVPGTSNPITSLTINPPTGSDLSSDFIWSPDDKLFLAYGLKIKKETDATTTVSPAGANNFTIEVQDNFGNSNTRFQSIAPGGIGEVSSITVGLPGNTAAPWNMRTGGQSQNFYEVRNAAGTLIGQMDSGVWYYKFQEGQDATGYGAGGGGAIKGTGNHPWDGKTWQVHGGNGAPGLIVVEAYSV